MALGAVITLAASVAALTGAVIYLARSLAKAFSKLGEARTEATNRTEALYTQRTTTRRLQFELDQRDRAFSRLEQAHQEAQASRQRVKAKLERVLRKAAHEKSPSAIDSVLRDSLQELYDVSGDDDAEGGADEASPESD